VFILQIKWEYENIFLILSTELNIVRWHILIFYFFLINNIPFYWTGFSEFDRCTPLNIIFSSKSRTLRQQNSWLFFSSTSLAHFVWTFVQIDILLMHKTYRPRILSVLFQLKGLISESMKIFFSLSTELNIVRWHTYFWFFWWTIWTCIPFYWTLFSEFVRWTPLNNIFSSKSRTLRQQNSWLFLSSTSLAHFVWTFVQIDILLIHKTYRPSILSVLFQLNGLISESMKIFLSYWVQN